MAVLTNFPLDYKDQFEGIEIFNGLKRDRDDAANATEAAPRKPVGSLPDPPDPGSQRGSSHL